MKLKRNLSTPESRELWHFVDETRRMVEQWPDWMKGTGSYAVRSGAAHQRPASRPAPPEKKKS